MYPCLCFELCTRRLSSPGPILQIETEEVRNTRIRPKAHNTTCFVLLFTLRSASPPVAIMYGLVGCQSSVLAPASWAAIFLPGCLGMIDIVHNQMATVCYQSENCRAKKIVSTLAARYCCNKVAAELTVVVKGTPSNISYGFTLWVESFRTLPSV